MLDMPLESQMQADLTLPVEGGWEKKPAWPKLTDIFVLSMGKDPLSHISMVALDLVVGLNRATCMSALVVVDHAYGGDFFWSTGMDGHH
jgi:hypothetical protein